MPSMTIRLRPEAHEALKEIAAATGGSLQDELDQAIALRRRMIYLEGLKADYAALARDPKAIADFQKEVDLWDRTSGDGLEGL